MPFEARVRARREAPLHVQLRLTGVPTQCPKPADEVPIEGCVVQVFRGQGFVEPGATIRFPLWICTKGDEPTGPAYVYHDALLAASHIEAYLYGTPPECQVAVYEFVLLEAASQHPMLSVNDLGGFEHEPVPGVVGSPG